MPNHISSNYTQSGNLAVQQPSCNGWEISYNPDNKRWYVHHPITDDTMAVFRHRKNAMAWARKHDVAKIHLSRQCHPVPDQ